MIFELQFHLNISSEEALRYYQTHGEHPKKCV